ncbi:hypothetical protein PO124_10950 [Bacillus licheniformis]|nr:hypothetical protein [Bacillus licheniformis]
MYITGRSIRGASTNQWPGTIDDTVSQIEASGGKAIAVRCDHTNDAETEAVIAKFAKSKETGYLINNVWGRTIWVSRQSLLGIVIENWDTMFAAGCVPSWRQTTSPCRSFAK